MMRAFAYLLATLASVGIVIVLVTLPDQRPDSAGARPDFAVEDDSAASVAGEPNRVMDRAGTLTLHVPEMHCPFACYPAVKETLESDGAVSGVELTEQKQEGVIDKPEVIVRYDEGFNVDAAINSLAQQGFGGSGVVQ